MPRLRPSLPPSSRAGTKGGTTRTEIRLKPVRPAAAGASRARHRAVRARSRRACRRRRTTRPPCSARRRDRPRASAGARPAWWRPCLRWPRRPSTARRPGAGGDRCSCASAAAATGVRCRAPCGPRPGRAAAGRGRPRRAPRSSGCSRKQPPARSTRHHDPECPRRSCVADPAGGRAAAAATAPPTTSHSGRIASELYSPGPSWSAASRTSDAHTHVAGERIAPRTPGGPQRDCQRAEQRESRRRSELRGQVQQLVRGVGGHEEGIERARVGQQQRAVLLDFDRVEAGADARQRVLADDAERERVAGQARGHDVANEPLSLEPFLQTADRRRVVRGRQPVAGEQRPPTAGSRAAQQERGPFAVRSSRRAPRAGRPTAAWPATSPRGPCGCQRRRCRAASSSRSAPVSSASRPRAEPHSGSSRKNARAASPSAQQNEVTPFQRSK